MDDSRLVEDAQVTTLHKHRVISDGQYVVRVDDGETRVWLARTTMDDGEPFDNKVSIEKLVGGRWETVEEYEG